eukprot:905997-Alexandrium_andersonii.AAC.1
MTKIRHESNMCHQVALPRAESREGRRGEGEAQQVHRAAQMLAEPIRHPSWASWGRSVPGRDLGADRPNFGRR